MRQDTQARSGSPFQAIRAIGHTVIFVRDMAAMRRFYELLAPPTDQPFGHRTLFFRDPDGNLPEVFAEIGVPNERPNPDP